MKILDRKSTAEFKRQFRLHNGDVKKVAKKLKKSVSTVYTYSIELGLREQKSKSKNLDRLAVAIEKLSRKQLHAGAIAEKLNEPVQKIQRLSRVYGIFLVRKKHKLKYTPEILIKIYEKSKGSYTLMARRLGVASSSVSIMMRKHNLNKKYPASHVRH